MWGERFLDRDLYDFKKFFPEGTYTLQRQDRNGVLWWKSTHYSLSLTRPDSYSDHMIDGRFRNSNKVKRHFIRCLKEGRDNVPTSQSIKNHFRD